MSGKVLRHFQDKSTHWFISNFRFFWGGIRGMCWGVLICFSSSLLSIFRVKNQVQIMNNYHQTSLFTIQILFWSLINQENHRNTIENHRKFEKQIRKNQEHPGKIFKNHRKSQPAVALGLFTHLSLPLIYQIQQSLFRSCFLCRLRGARLRNDEHIATT